MRTYHCDFCNVALPESQLWTYDATSFAGAIIGFDKDLTPKATAPWGSEGAWAACTECHDLIEADRWHALAVRSVESEHGLVKFRSQEERAECIDLMEQMHRSFREHRTGILYKGAPK